MLDEMFQPDHQSEIGLSLTPAKSYLGEYELAIRYLMAMKNCKKKVQTHSAFKSSSVVKHLCFTDRVFNNFMTRVASKQYTL